MINYPYSILIKHIISYEFIIIYEFLQNTNIVNRNGYLFY